MKQDDDFSNIVTNWLVESKLYREEFENYSQALSMFTKISRDGTQVILYEIKRNRVDRSILKKTPLLNSKKAKTKPASFKGVFYSRPKDKSDDHSKNKNRYIGLKVRIFLLIIVLLAFIIIVFLMNSIAGELPSVTSINNFTLYIKDNSS